MGRTLVMPPEKKMYLLGKGDNKQKQHFNFVDFFPIDELVKEHIGFEVISMQEYLETQAMTGQLRHKVSKGGTTVHFLVSVHNRNWFLLVDFRTQER